MDDFNNKIKLLKEKYNIKKILKIFLTLFAIFICILILILIFSKNNNEVPTDNIPLIKSEVSEIKIVPDNQGGLVVDNLDVSIYDIIDNSEEIVENPTINKIEQNVEFDRSNEIGYLSDKDQLAEKINEIGENKDLITEKPTLDDNKPKNKPNITINNSTPKEQPLDLKELEKLGNKSLVRNLKDKKDIKPGVRVQFLALKSRDGLIEYWNELVNKYKDLLSDKNYYIEKADINGIEIYRLQVGTFQTEENAREFCKKYIEITNKNKIDCILVKD